MHPSLRIVALILLAIAVQSLQVSVLAGGGAFLLLVAAATYPSLLRKMLRRSRWLLLTLLLIFAFTTPGEYLPWWTLQLAPTYEGLRGGLLQAARLVIMLAGLALLLGSTSREQLMAGIYQLLLPLQLLGLRVERFTARLWLTLHYVEEDPPKAHGNVWAALSRMAEAEQAAADAPVRFAMPDFHWVDYGIIVGACIATGWWLA